MQRGARHAGTESEMLFLVSGHAGRVARSRVNTNRESRHFCSPKLLSVVVFLPDADEASILSDLDLDLIATRFLNLSLVISLTVFGFLLSFGDSSSSKIVLDGLLQRS